MKSLTEILSEIDGHDLAMLSEVETGHDLDQAQLKIALKDQVKNLYENYDLKSGHTVIIKSANSIKFFIDFLSLYFLEITSVPIDPGINSLEYQNLISTIKPQLVLTEEEIIRHPGIVRDAFIGIALILFTSGTTSSPKGVMVSKVALEAKMQLFDQVIGADTVERSLCFVPTYFGHGLICNSLYPIFRGKRFLIAKSMSLEFAQKLTGLLTKEKITFFSSVPSHWEFILHFAEQLKGHSLKRVHSASAPLRSDKAQRILEWLGPQVNFYDIYGATEMLGWFAGKKMTAGEAESTFEDFWAVEKRLNDQGEMIVKSDYMSRGYWQNEQIVAFDEFNTGDIFKGNALKGRSKNVINKNGIKIQIEDIVHDVHKSGLVMDASAFPIPDDYAGERIGLFVVLKPGTSVESLWKYCQSSVSSFKIPSEIICVNKIPVNKRGKSSPIELQKVFIELGQLDQEVLQLFNQIFKTDFKTTDIGRDNVPHWDSMRHAELIIKMQKKFDVKFTANDLIRTDNLKELVSLVKKSKLDS